MEKTEDIQEPIAWINEKDRIVTFREREGFEKRTYRTQEEKLTRIYELCRSGYRIL